MPRLISRDTSLSLSARHTLRAALLSASILVLPHAVHAQDSGQGTLNFSMPSAGQPAPQPVYNPYDVADPVNPATTEAAVQNTQKHWTQMNYAELKAELARTDTNYSMKLRGEMEARLKTLEDAALTGGVAATAGEVPPVAPETANAPAAAAPAAAAAPVVVIPPTDNTPWWKKPKSERAAAREAARTQAAGGQPQEERELTPQEKIYEQIRNNRGR